MRIFARDFAAQPRPQFLTDFKDQYAKMSVVKSSIKKLPDKKLYFQPCGLQTASTSKQILWSTIRHFFLYVGEWKFSLKLLYATRLFSTLQSNLRDDSLVGSGPDSRDGGYKNGLIRSDCIVPWSVPMSVRLCLSAQPENTSTDGKFVGCRWDLCPLKLGDPLAVVTRKYDFSDRRCSNLIWALRPSKVAGLSHVSDSYLVDDASSHMLVSKIKPCMSKYKPH